MSWRTCSENVRSVKQQLLVQSTSFYCENYCRTVHQKNSWAFNLNSRNLLWIYPSNNAFVLLRSKHENSDLYNFFNGGLIFFLKIHLSQEKCSISIFQLTGDFYGEHTSADQVADQPKKSSRFRRNIERMVGPPTLG